MLATPGISDGVSLEKSTVSTLTHVIVVVGDLLWCALHVFIVDFQQLQVFRTLVASVGCTDACKYWWYVSLTLGPEKYLLTTAV